MDGIIRRTFDEPDETITFEHGEASRVQAGESAVWRSVLRPGWSWDSDVKTMAGGLAACPMTHREYVIAGRIRYRMTDGTGVEGAPGDHLFIPPGHNAWVVGDEDCVLIDW